MVKNLTVVALLVVVFASVSRGDKCRAHAGHFGDECISNVVIDGSPGLIVTYNVNAEGVSDTNVCCSGFSPKHGKYQKIGCGQNGVFSSTVQWGNHSGKPKIKCEGNPRAATVIWRHRQ